MVRRRVIVEGRVQGVGFRVACARQAERAGLAGAVRNLPDGRVEAIFEGPEARVDAVVAWCRTGPRSARVERVLVVELAPAGEVGFRIG